jgi:Flp pilus assembly protein TadG
VTPPRILRRIERDDRGSGYVAAFVVLFTVLTVAGVGVLVDSARVVTAQRDASAAAYEAARAGAQALTLGSARLDAAAVIDVDAARSAVLAAADQLLAGTNAAVTAITVTADAVAVTVSRRVDPWFPMGPARTVTETGSVRVAAGISQEGQ